MKHRLVWVHETTKNPLKGYLDFDSTWSVGVDAKGHGVTLALINQVTLEQLANTCDQNAESRNNHGFVGAHRVLAAVLYRTIGREQATQVMWEIASYGGLDYASGNGISSRFAAWSDLGVTEPWQDWKL